MIFAIEPPEGTTFGLWNNYFIQKFNIKISFWNGFSLNLIFILLTWTWEN